MVRSFCTLRKNCCLGFLFRLYAAAKGLCPLDYRKPIKKGLDPKLILNDSDICPKNKKRPKRTKRSRQERTSVKSQNAALTSKSVKTRGLLLNRGTFMNTRDDFFFFLSRLYCRLRNWQAPHRIGDGRTSVVLGLYRRWGNKPRPERKTKTAIGIRTDPIRSNFNCRDTRHNFQQASNSDYTRRAQH